MSDHFWHSMPKDPFEDDPDDPSRLIGDEAEFEPLDERERLEVIEDLAAVRAFRRIMSPAGFLGVSMLCEDCGEPHFYAWDVLEAHYLTLLSDRPSPVHEPEFAPDEDRYAPWDYCAGYVDGWLGRRA